MGRVCRLPEAAGFREARSRFHGSRSEGNPRKRALFRSALADRAHGTSRHVRNWRGRPCDSRRRRRRRRQRPALRLRTNVSASDDASNPALGLPALTVARRQSD
jgi:hypothetical protein